MTTVPQPFKDESIDTYHVRCCQAMKDLSAQYEYKMLNLKAKPDKKLQNTIQENITLKYTIKELKTKLEPYEELERDYGSYKEIVGISHSTKAMVEGTKAAFEDVNEYHEYIDRLNALYEKAVKF